MDDILDRALKDYKANFGQDFDPSWNPTSEKDLEDKLRASKVDFMKWRSKHARLWEALTAVSVPVTNIASLAGQAASDAFPGASAAVGGLLSLVTACEKVSEAYGYIEQVFVKLEDVLTQWKKDFEHEVDDQLKTKMRRILGVLLAIIVRSRQLIKRGRMRHWLARLTFGDDKKTTEYFKALQDLLQAENQTRTALIMDKVIALWEKSVESENKHLFEELNSPAVKDNEKTFVEKLEDKVTNSSRWYQDEPLYQQWSQNKISLLMLLGGPGCGKSYLTATIVEDLTRIYYSVTSSDTDTSVAYFFLHQGDSLSDMLKVLAYQLQTTNQAYRQHIVDTFDEGEPLSMRQIWAKLFLDFWNAKINPQARLVLVIDELNAAASHELQVFAGKIVKEAIRDPSCNIQLILLGQLELWAEFSFIASEGYIEINSKKNRDDIAAYIDREFASFRLLRKNESVKIEFKEKILERCDGIFTWASLLVAKCKSQELGRIRRLLDDPPKDLDNMIKSCFDQIMDNEELDPLVLRSLLMLLAYAKRPLSFGEAYHMVCLATGEERLALLWLNIVQKLSSVIRWRATRRLRKESQEDVDADHIEVLEDDNAEWSKHTSTMILSFSNSRIHRYVLNQSEIEAQQSTEPSKRWPPPSQKAESQMGIMCINMLQSQKVHRDGTKFVMRYPVQCCAPHLQALDLAKMDSDDRKEILLGLIWLLNNEEGLRITTMRGPFSVDDSVKEFFRLWVETKDNVRFVQTLLQYAVDDNLEMESNVKDWVRTAFKSTKELLRPLVGFLRRSWLNPDFSPDFLTKSTEYRAVAMLAVTFLPAYDQLNQAEEFPLRFQQYSLFELFAVSANEIEAAAKSSGLPETPAYHVAVAYTLSARAHSREAMKHVESFPESDGLAWLALWLQAQYHAHANELEQALTLTRKAIELNPEGRVEMEPSITTWLMWMHDLKGALQAAETAYAWSTEHVTARKLYFACLALSENVPEILKLIRELDRMPAKDESQHSQLFEILVPREGDDATEIWPWPAMGQAYIHSQSLSDKDFILDVIRRGTNSVNQSQGEMQQVRWLNRVADFSAHYEDNGSRRAVDQLLSNLTRAREGRIVTDPNRKMRLFIETRQAYAVAVYRLACKQEVEADEDLPKSIAIMESLAQEGQELNKAILPHGQAFEADTPAYLYARWLRSHPTHKEEDWRKYARATILKYLDYLDDSEAHNDFIATKALLSYFRILGDTTNTMAVLALMMSAQDMRSNKYKATKANVSAVKSTLSSTNHKSDRSPTPRISSVHNSDSREGTVPTTISASNNDDPEKGFPVQLQFDVRLGCDWCYAQYQYADGLYMCEECLQTKCQRCMPTTETDRVMGHACGIHHNHIKYWPTSENDLNAATIVKEDGQIQVKKSWLDKMRKEWAEPKDKGGAPTQNDPTT